MMTQTHILVAVGLLGRPGETGRNLAAIAGGIIPDAAIFVLYAIEKFRGTAESVIWSDVYFSDFWQDVVAWGNSIPLWVSVLLVGWLLCRKLPTVSTLLIIFSCSCLAHMALDLPVHVDDAHRHFFPLGNFRFRSAVSYWDPKHYGAIAATCEAAMGIALSIWLLRKFKSWIARSGIALMAVGYLAVPVYFAIQFFSKGN